MDTEHIPYMTTAEVAARLHVHPRTIQRAILHHELRAVKMGTSGWRISEADLQTWLDSRANKPAPERRTR
jgi:excisionase family DNA binding protein